MNGFQNNTYQKEYARIKMWLILNFLLYITIECISSLNLLERAAFLAGHLDIFLINYILLLIITCPCLLFPKMAFVFNLFAIGIFILTYASRILMIIRGLPLRWPDFFIAGEGLSIANKYLSSDIIMLVIILVFIGFFFLIKSYSYHSELYHPKLVIGFIIIITSINMAVVSRAERNDTIRSSGSVDYSGDEGMVYSFVSSYETTNSSIPKEYSKEAIDRIKAELQSASKQITSPKQPNIIFLQVESFIDPLRLKGIAFSRDPVANMRPYMSGDWSGHMQAPGINTARTEFEILTGVRIADLFKYEVPYTSDELDGRPIETIAQLLKKNNHYHTTAIHNHEANFYSRDKMYSHLGFDNFIPVEYMENVEYTKNWPKDNVLLPYIEKTIQDTPGRDFVFTVTVGTHSSYEYNYEDNTSGIIIGGDIEDNVRHQTQDYIDRLSETDRFVGDVIHYVQQAKEPTVLVVYGDHIPALDLITYDKEYIKDQVPYFIVSNYKLNGKADAVIPAYRMYTQVLNTVGIKSGIISSVHNTFNNQQDYFDKLNLTAYDLLMGHSYILDGQTNYQNTELQFGTP